MATGNRNFEIIAACLIAHERQLTDYARWLTANDLSAAKDLFQETACRALLNVDKYAGFGYPEAWLRTIMRNIFLNERTGAYGSLKVPAEVADLPIADPSPLPDDAVTLREIEDAIGRLGSDRDKIMMARWIQGYSYAEIADELGLRLGTVKSSIFRLVRLLRAKLK